MNDILEKRIEAAADGYAEKALPAYVNGDFGRSQMADAFESGAEYAISHQWIRVEEALPELGEDVLVIFPDKSTTVASRRKIFNEFVGDVIVWANGEYSYHDSWIRYWMPIPKFKTKEKEE